jgi:hypothetical protein
MVKGGGAWMVKGRGWLKGGGGARMVKGRGGCGWIKGR